MSVLLCKRVASREITYYTTNNCSKKSGDST